MVDGRRITDKGTLDIVTMVYAGLPTNRSWPDSRPPDAMHRAVGRRRQRRDGTPPRTRTDRLRLRGRHRTCQPWIAAQAAGGRRHARILRHHARRAGHAAQLQRRQRGFVHCARERRKLHPRSWFSASKKAACCATRRTRRRSSAKSRPKSYAALKAGGIVSKGMIPKVENALKAVANGVRSVTIKHSEKL